MSKAHSDRNGQSRKPELPRPGRIRWGARRKAAVVIGIRTGLITREEASRRYLLSPEELASWEAALDEHGYTGLTMKTLRQRRRVGAGRSPRR